MPIGPSLHPLDSHNREAFSSFSICSVADLKDDRTALISFRIYCCEFDDVVENSVLYFSFYFQTGAVICDRLNPGLITSGVGMRN